MPCCPAARPPEEPIGGLACLASENPRRHARAAWRTLAQACAAAAVSLALAVPAGAQFWGQWDYRPQRQYQPQQQYNPFGGGWFGNPMDMRPRREPREQREAPA